MYEQSDIHPYRRTVEEKSPLKPLEFLKKTGNFLKGFITLPFLFYALGAFLLARAQILGGLYPFALAFIAAQALRDRQYGLYAFLGAVIAVPFTVSGFEIVVQVGVYAILTILVYFYPSINKRLIVFPILAAAVNIVVKGTAASFLDGSSYNAMVILFESMLVGGLTPVLFVALRAEPWSKGTKLSIEEYVCFLLLVMALIMGVGDISYEFITVRGIVSRYFILIAAWLGGPGAGAAIGVLAGMIPSLSNMVAPSIVGNFAFSGLLAGAFKSFGKLGVIIGFILANMLLSIYYLNQPAVLGLISECLIAAVLLTITPNKIYNRLAMMGKGDYTEQLNKKEDVSLREMTAGRLREVSQIFNDMAGSFTHAACEDRNEEEELNKIFTNVSNHVCQDCGLNRICWENDRVKTCSGILELFKLMDIKGYINIKHINPSFKKRCSRMREMVAIISCMYDNYRLDSYWKKKFAENRQLVSSQMRGMASIMQKLSSEISGSIKMKHIMQNNIAHELEKQGLHVSEINVNSFSDKSTEISFNKDTCHGLYDCPKLVAKAVSNITGKDFNVYDGACSLEGQTNECRFKLVPKGNLRIAHAARQIIKEGNVITGDTVHSKMLKDGKQLLLLSDGMGSGPIAASESKHIAMLLEQLLETGFDKDTALKSVNAILLGKHGKDTFATIDLAVIDLFSAETDFIKVSAPASFIKRGHKVITLKAENPPIGIVNSYELETLSEKLQKDDYIIMLTDGVFEAVPAYNKEEWIADRLRELDNESPDDIVDRLLNKIIVAANGRIKDDMTVLVAYIY